MNTLNATIIHKYFKHHRDDKYKSWAYSFCKALNDMKVKTDATAN